MLMLMDAPLHTRPPPHPPPSTPSPLHTRPSDRLPQRTNKMMFVFAANPARRRTVLPGTYQEILMHVKGAREHARRGVAPSVRADLAHFFRESEGQNELASSSEVL